mgnify:CR=1 FL=1
MTSETTCPIEGMPVPQLRVGIVGGPRWRLCDQKPKHFTLLVVHRGAGCSSCGGLLHRIDARLGEFRRRGVAVVALSADDRPTTERFADALGIDRLPLGYGFSAEDAADWGVELLPPAPGEDPGRPRCAFTLFLVRRDGTLEMREVPPQGDLPGVDEILAAVDAAIGEADAGADAARADAADAARPLAQGSPVAEACPVAGAKAS